MKKTHGMSRTRIYKIWEAMKQRCYNQNEPSYKNYGGRGISVCQEWKSDFMSFYAWAMDNGYKEDLTIERIDNDGNYEPSNCKWITLQEQENNRRTTVFMELDGEKMSLKQWAEKTGNNYHSILRKRGRRKRGMKERSVYLNERKDEMRKKIELMDSIVEENPEITVNEIAARMGVSRKTIFRLRKRKKEEVI